jgi:alginate O-acetyltransferase complex protein AlgI
MAFNSITFLIFFAVVLAVHSLPLEWRLKKTNLLVASYVFYAAWNPPFIVLLWVSTLTDWFAAKHMAISTGRRKKLFLVLSIIVNLGLLGYFKYGRFLEENLSALLALVDIAYAVPDTNIILPLGISFYTFQSMSYSIDVYRGKIKPADSLLDFALYVSFFPQLVAGPIIRARFFLKQLGENGWRRVQDLGWGTALITLGMFQKVVLADGLLAPVVETVYGAAGDASGVDAWIGTLAFAGQIFFDFNGYSVIAVGLARCLGFKLPWNFLSPYASIGFSEFWRRWHVTLSAWLRDYLYISLSGSRRGPLRTFFNLSITMLLGGLWHGASWLFVLWGAAHGALLVIEHAGRLLFAGQRQFLDRKAVQGFLGLLTFIVICLTWVLFRADSLASASALFGAMLLPLQVAALVTTNDIVTVIVVMSGLLAAHVFMRHRSFDKTLKSLPWPFLATLLAAMLLAILLSPGEERDFIYFEF